MSRFSDDNQDPLALASDRALRLLSIRSRSSQEIKQRLLADGFSDPIAVQVLDKLSHAGLIDDRRFALERARAMGKGKGWGPQKLRKDLISRGISNELAEEAISQAYAPSSCHELMRRLVKKRFGNQTLTLQADLKIRSKAQRYLIGKGFDPEDVWALLPQD